MFTMCVVILPLSFVMVCQPPFLALQHVHALAAQAFVSCTPVWDFTAWFRCLCIFAIIATFPLCFCMMLVMICLSHIHMERTLLEVYSVFCCTPVFVCDGLATTASCIATYPRSGCTSVCRLYSSCLLTAWFNVSVYHCYHCSSVLPHHVGDDLSFTNTHTERTLLEVYSVCCCTPAFVCDGLATYPRSGCIMLACLLSESWCARHRRFERRC